MATFEDLQGRILRMLNDSEGVVYTTPLVIDAMNAALDAILPWQPKLGKATITGNGGCTYDLPTDCYDVDAIVADTTGEVLGRQVFAPGVLFSSYTQTENLWIYAPNNQVTFAKAISSGAVYSVHYLRPWGKISDASGLTATLETPEWVISPLTLYAVSYLLIQPSLDTSNLGQYKTRVDSGGPEDNPLQRSITYLQKLFTQEMNRHPKYQRAQV